MKHTHYWSYLHTVYEGSEGDDDSVSVVRYCACGVRQRAFVDKWSRLPKDHDANEMIERGALA